MSINTKRVPRRVLHFETEQQILDEAERLAAGNVRTLGNWSAGQIFKHLAIAMEGSIDGLNVTFPWYIRLIVPRFKTQILARPMPSGFRLPRRGEVLLVPRELISAAEGLQSLRTAVARQLNTSERKPSWILGPLTRDEWRQFHCRHAELHLSFLTTE